MENIKISEFYGMDVCIIPNSKNIVATYNDWEAIFDIDTATIIKGEFPPEGTEDIIDWIEENRDELTNMVITKDYHRIKPLE